MTTRSRSLSSRPNLTSLNRPRAARTVATTSTARMRARTREVVPTSVPMRAKVCLLFAQRERSVLSCTSCAGEDWDELERRAAKGELFRGSDPTVHMTLK